MDMNSTDNEQASINLDPPSQGFQADVDVAQPELERELDPTPSTSRTENPVQMPSVVVVPPNDLNHPLSVAPEPVPPAESTEKIATEELGLDGELLDILGIDPTTEKKYGKEIQKDLSTRLQHWTTMGLTKELTKELKEKYLTPENCKLIDPPKLNPEIKAAVADIIAKRDKAIENKQKLLTTAIACLGEAITLILTAKEKNTTLLKLLTDTARIICECQHADSTTRRNFLLNSVKKEVREQLQNTKIDTLLFGANLAETLKSAKAINKSGTDLKQPAPKVQNKKPTQNASNSSKNWKPQGPVRRQTAPQRTKEPAVNSTRGRPTNSFKQSQTPQQRPSYNRR